MADTYIEIADFTDDQELTPDQTIIDETNREIERVLIAKRISLSSITLPDEHLKDLGRAFAYWRVFTREATDNESAFLVKAKGFKTLYEERKKTISAGLFGVPSITGVISIGRG